MVDRLDLSARAFTAVYIKSLTVGRTGDGPVIGFACEILFARHDGAFSGPVIVIEGAVACDEQRSIRDAEDAALDLAVALLSRASQLSRDDLRCALDQRRKIAAGDGEASS